MTDTTFDGDVEEGLARLSEEERGRLLAQAAVATPLRLPVAFAVQSLQSRDGEPAVLLSTQTPAVIQRLVLSREEALALASQLRKAANTGPSLAVPRLVVP